MNWRTTWILLGIAAVLSVFTYFFEQHQNSRQTDGGPPRLVVLRPAEVSAIQIRRTNQFLLRVERTNGIWNLTAPLAYPAQPFAIEGLLHTLGNLHSQTFISFDELKSSRRTIAEYGLDVPVATVILQQGQRRIEVAVGSRTPVGDQMYVQISDSRGIHVVNAQLADQLPKLVNDWRDPTLITFTGINFDRVEARSAGRGFALQFDPTNSSVVLIKPTPARASTPKVIEFVKQIRDARITQFVSDEARDDLDALGLQPPEAELAFRLGTNDAAIFQFGKSPATNAAQVYARRADRNNVVLVPRTVLDALQTPYGELRDRRLLAFAPEAVDTVEIVDGIAETVSIRRQFNGAWIVVDAQATIADGQLMKQYLDRLSRLEGNVEKDVVTDFAPYGLEPVARHYWLKSTLTNAAGQITNRILAQLDVGARRGDVVFARGAEDKTVYAVPVSEITALPRAAWQLRDRRVWSFTTNQVTRLAVTHNGYTRQMVRNGNSAWALAPGSEGVIVSEAIEEALYRLGELRAAMWVAPRDDQRSAFGFNGEGYRLAIDLKNGDKPQTLSLEFGGRAPSLYPYAMTAVDGQNWIFEFPLQLYLELLRDLSNPPLRGERGVAER
jgi:hypothetical protein